MELMIDHEDNPFVHKKSSNLRARIDLQNFLFYRTHTIHKTYRRGPQLGGF
jgi:hypothetical protein